MEGFNFFKKKENTATTPETQEDAVDKAFNDIQDEQKALEDEFGTEAAHEAFSRLSRPVESIASELADFPPASSQLWKSLGHMKQTYGEDAVNQALMRIISEEKSA